MLKILFAGILLICVLTMKPKGFPKHKLLIQQEPTTYETKYYKQKVSHYNFKLQGKTFEQKYLVVSGSWNKESKGPILMYCGNEGPIEMFYRNSGFYNNVVAQELGGLLVYPQHRYFGASMPFGTQKKSYQKQNLVYLTTEEALMDFVEFAKFIKASYCSDCPVIAFGGSYGGMLAAWIRMKYPNVVDMAHAASAPIYYYKNRQQLDLGIFYKIVTKNYKMHNSNCPDVIREGFRRLLAYSKQERAPLSDITSDFNLCKPLKTHKQIPLLIDYINTAYSYMAMLNYPYPTSFLKNLTSWPANTSCLPLDSLTTRSQDTSLFKGIKQSIEYYYSFGKQQCNDIHGDSSSDQDMSGWNVLACADQAMPMTTDGSEDMFYPESFSYQAYSAQCEASFQIRPDYEYTLNHFGGVTDEEYKAASKIIFTNGGLDPWSGASPTQNLTDTLLACFIPKGAHHLDLRDPNPADPREVVDCRKFVISTIKQWAGSMKLASNIRTQ